MRHIWFGWALFIALGVCQSAGSETMETWTVCTGPELAKEPAITAAIEDLQQDGARFGLTFVPMVAPEDPPGNVVVVGGASRNAAGQRVLEKVGMSPEEPSEPQAFVIRSARTEHGRAISVAGGSVLGDAYGLYWLWDRMRVYGEIPDMDLKRAPALEVRLTEGGSIANIRNALRYTATWVSGGLIDNLLPWHSEPEATRNAKEREEFQKLIDAAHAFHLKYLATGDEFSYHPTLLEEFGATLDPADPALWDALQAKYRWLFEVLPDLDGVRLRTGEHTRITGTYKPFDIMHEPAECDWPLEKRYQTFVRKVHEVVVGEFDKIYYHRTWVTNTDEQHSDPQVYRGIFTDDVPVRNLYLSPYLSAGDRWYYQPYNATFNLTPHHMVVLLSRLDYHAAGGTEVFPSFPGQYYQGGLKQILSLADNNLAGAHFNVSRDPDWSTDGLTAYTAFRLAWEPDLPLRVIAEDYAAIHLGREVAADMAEILLLSHQAYKDGIYVKPVAESLTWNTLPHLRLNTFEARGYPFVDDGREHIEWLKSSMYEPSKGRIEEAIEYLDKGRDAARRMQALYEPLAPKIADAELAKEIGDSLEVTRWLVETNNLYVKTCYAYFEYREAPSDDTREHLAKTLGELESARTALIAAPGSNYHLFGIDQLVRSAHAALDDLDAAEETLAEAPDAAGVLEAIAAHQQTYAKALGEHEQDAVKLLTWKGKVDGKDILSVCGDRVHIDHIQDDPIHSVTYTFHGKLPRKPVTVLFRDIQSRTIHPFVFEQPTADHNYTFRLFIADRGRGYAWWEFELFYVEKTPEELGLAVFWQH